MSEVWRVRPTVAHVDIGDRVVVLALDRLAEAGPIILEGNSAAIWRSVQAGGDDQAICEDVAAAYATLPALITPDVIAFLHQLEAARLIERLTSASQ